MKSKDSLPAQWQRWLAENSMLEVEDRRLMTILAEEGFDEKVIGRAMSSLTDDPHFQAGLWIAQRYKKLESLMEIHRQLSNLSDKSAAVERRNGLSRADFLKHYYSENRPVVIEGIMGGWTALSRWNPEYLKETCGEMIVEITSGREADAHYELNLETHKVKILFKDYVDMVVRGGKTNDYYLVANNFFLKEKGARQLYDDIDQFPEYLDQSERTSNGSFWFGPAGTVTPLHHDLMNIMVAQVYGRKRFTLIPANHAHMVYNEKGVFSEVDLESPDLDQYPMFKDASKLEIILEPGEVLFVPVGWWHHVRSLDVSITVSFINFVFANSYNWSHPHIYR